jgi:hypothetical protein
MGSSAPTLVAGFGEFGGIEVEFVFVGAGGIGKKWFDAARARFGPSGLMECELLPIRAEPCWFSSFVVYETKRCFNATASVQSTGPAGGTVTFSVVNAGGFTPVPVGNGTATLPLALGTAGIYQICAIYSGDAGNKASQSAPVILDVTGDVTVVITGTTGPLMNRLIFPLSIQ